MRKSEIEELHYITHISNVKSIIRNGILSHKKAAAIEHENIDMQEVQAKRENKSVPGGKALHEYVNLYLCARNPMLYKRKNCHREICVLRVNHSVLDMPDVVITTGNAASNYTAFHAVADELPELDKNLIFAEYWSFQEDDDIEKCRKKTAKCAEVLVPNYVNPSFIFGAYVSCKLAELRLKESVPELEVSLNPKMFFKND